MPQAFARSQGARIKGWDDAVVNPVRTVVFSDIVGSTALYEVLGNAAASGAVTALTREMGLAIKHHGGRVVKKLGDGVLGVFENAGDAVAAMVALMRVQRLAKRDLPETHRLAMRIGVASGELVEMDGDCYGDAVNVAARLCERAGADEIWATEEAVRATHAQRGVGLVRLGHIDIRGKSEAVVAYQIVWREEQDQESLTVQASLPSRLGVLDTGFGSIGLAWNGTSLDFASMDGPVHVGRASDCHVCVHDPRVSRLHARLDWHQGLVVLTDLSSFGTWVRFADSDAPVALRRDSCLLHGNGEIALGVSFADPSAPKVDFAISSAGLHTG